VEAPGPVLSVEGGAHLSQRHYVFF
jgi:hypothetical protein